MIFLILFDILYLIVWMFTIEMNPLKAIVVAGITALLMPWARSINTQSQKRVVIRSYGVDLYRKYQKSRIH
ncbi:MAG TPA: hypothetical protein DCL77_13995 [Prolixibacteraceae bacterium]|nr:hypothetical protein [Prolixibacteraceae bacterium]